MSLYEALRDSLRAEEPVALATVVSAARAGSEAGAGEEAPGQRGSGQPDRADPPDPPDPQDHPALPALGAKLVVRPSQPVLGSLGDAGLDRVVARDALGALAAGLSDVRHYGPHGEARQDEVSVFLEAFAPPPQMVIFGAVDFTAALARIGKVLGYRVTVCDARPVFATRARFPMADEVVADWPDRHLAKVGAGLGPRDVVCVLTHDPKFDVPAILAALETRVGYIGAMGSRRTHAERSERLVEAGVSDEGINRVMGPIGVDIGARTPEETAVSIAAEIIAMRTGRAVRSLRDTDGPVHPSPTS